MPGFPCGGESGHTANWGYSMKHSSLFTLAVMAAAYLVVASPSDAASMTWGTPTTVTNVLDIDVSGDAVHAGSWGTTGNLDVRASDR